MDLLQRLERHLRRSATSATKFGRDALGDPSFVRELRNGRKPRPTTAARLAAVLDQAEAADGGGDAHGRR